MTTGIAFSGEASWIAASQPEMLSLARSSVVTPLAVRVLLAAMGRAGPSGHAPFSVGELRGILGDLDIGTGELRRARADTVSRAIGAAIQLGYIGPTSTARCLVLRTHMFQRGGRMSATWSCPEHGRLR